MAFVDQYADSLSYCMKPAGPFPRVDRDELVLVVQLDDRVGRLQRALPINAYGAGYSALRRTMWPSRWTMTSFQTEITGGTSGNATSSGFSIAKRASGCSWVVPCVRVPTSCRTHSRSRFASARSRNSRSGTKGFLTYLTSDSTTPFFWGLRGGQASILKP